MDDSIDLLVEGGRVVTDGTVRDCTVVIREGKIAALPDGGTPWPGADGVPRLDATGLTVMPGVIDAHAHFANFNEQTDDFASLSTSAAFGGVTTVIPYIQGRIGMPAGESLRHFRDEGEAQSVVDFAMHCRVQAPERGTASRQFDIAFDLGVTSFKLFMAYRKQGILWDDYSLLSALEYLGRRGGIYCCHAENGDIIDYLEDKFQEGERYTPENLLAARPPEAEAEATYRALTLSRLANCPLYLVHVTTERALKLASNARAEAQQVWIETCPHYLTLTSAETSRQGGFAKTAPPLRADSDVAAMGRAVMDGTIDVIASDHAPWPFENKALPPEFFAEVYFGIPGVETMLPLMYSEFVATGRIDLPRLAELLCEAPARVFGLAPRKGSIQVGADADLVLIDPKAEWRISADKLHTLAGYTPFEGRTVRGRVEATILRGELIVRDGSLTASHGFGEYIPRQAKADNPRRNSSHAG